MLENTNSDHESLDSLLDDITAVNIRVATRIASMNELTVEQFSESDFAMCMDTFFCGLKSYIKYFFSHEYTHEASYVKAHLSFLGLIFMFYDWLAPERIQIRNEAEHFGVVLKNTILAKLQSGTDHFFTLPSKVDKRHVEDISDLLSDLIYFLLPLGPHENEDDAVSNFLLILRVSTRKGERTKNLSNLENLLSKPYAQHSKFKFSLGKIDKSVAYPHLIELMANCSKLLDTAGIPTPAPWEVFVSSSNRNT